MGKFCNLCGEKVYAEHDKSIAHFLEEGFHFITHFDGTLFTTAKAMRATPGKLSLDYCNGLRKKYFKPVPFFLLLVVIYLLFPYFEGLNMQLKFHLRNIFYGSYATKQVENLLQRGMTYEELAIAFHTRSITISKFLLLLLIPLTALFFWAIIFRNRKYFFDQMVFGSEINAVFLLWGFLILPLLIIVVCMLLRKVFQLSLNFGDDISALLIYIPVCTYLGFALDRFYGYRFWKSASITFLFLAVHAFIVSDNL